MTVLEFPQIIVEVAFTVGASTGAYLHLDDAARGLLDTATLAPDGVWTDVSAWFESAAIKRGAQRVDLPILRYETGTCTLVLFDTDRRFDPTNLSGPYVSGGRTQVTPMRAVRIRAVWDGVTYDLYRGFADDWIIEWVDPGYAQVTIPCSDGFKVLAALDRTALGFPVGAGDTSVDRIHRILDSAQWPAADREIDPVGHSEMRESTMAGDPLTEMYLVADSEIGELYIDGAGRVRFRSRLDIFTKPVSNTSQATFGDDGTELPYTALGISYDDANMANQVKIARVGGTQQTAEDAASMGEFLIHTHERTDLLLVSDAESLDYARFLLHLAKDPELRFTSLTFEPLEQGADLWPQALGREIGDRITVNRRPPGGGTITRDAFVRGMEHTFTATSWTTTWPLQSATRYSFLILDHSTNGALDSNALAY